MTAGSLAERVHRHCLAHGLFPAPGGAVVAVSGGPDSLALLDVMAALAPRLGLTLVVAHADHGILPESAEVAARVVAIAERYAAPCAVGRLALGAGAGETRAREARYRFLRDVQRARGARYLLTAHHADDQVETVVLRVLHGSGPLGLAGIAPVGPEGLVRPLLAFRHAELAAHAASLGLPVATDPSNSDPRHLRAWVRGALLPLVRSRLGAAAGDALLAVAAHAARDTAAWDAALDVMPELDARARVGHCDVARGALTGYHNVLAERVLRAVARRSGLRLGPEAAARAVAFAGRSTSGHRLDLGGGLTAEIAFDRLVIAADADVPAPVRISGGSGSASFGAWHVAWRAEPRAAAPAARASWTTWLAPTDACEVRAPVPGDRLVPLGGTGRRRVARLLMEARVARGERASYPVLACGSRPVWLPGVARAADHLPAPDAAALRIDVGRG